MKHPPPAHHRTGRQHHPFELPPNTQKIGLLHNNDDAHNHNKMQYKWQLSREQNLQIQPQHKLNSQQVQEPPPANDAPCHQHKVSSAHLGGSSKYLYETYEDPSRSGKRFHVNSPLPTGLKYLTMSQKPTTHPPPWAPLLQFQAPHYSSDIYEKYVYFSIFPVALL